MVRVLGIESSCDETAAAVVEDGKRLLSNVVASSMDLHVQYGGVVPEIAARSHIEVILPVIKQALSDADCTWDDIDAIAVTYGAGLGGSLLVGVLTARTLAIAQNKPLYAVNHVEGHLYANFITETTLPNLTLPEKQPEFPILGLIVSGGHSQLVLFKNHFDYVLLGQTHDDAIGEAFDKVAKLLGLPYPGGISVERLAAAGNPDAFDLPKARMASVSPALARLREEVHTGKDDNDLPKHSYDFSFSGLKTAVLRLAQTEVGKDHTLPSTRLAALLNDEQKADIAATFVRVAIETVVDKAVLACNEFQPKSFIIGGGVAGSPPLRAALAERLPIPAEYTDRKLCTDNGAMIATLGCFKHMRGAPQADPYTLDIKPNLSM